MFALTTFNCKVTVAIVINSVDSMHLDLLHLDLLNVFCVFD